MSEAQTLGSGLDRARRELLSAGRNLWLAGLGAVVEVEEGSRDLFDRLVERGRPVETSQRKALDKAGHQTQKAFRELGKLVQDTMEYETKGVLKRFGMMTREDVRALSTRLETLARKIDELSVRQDHMPLIVTGISDVTTEKTAAVSAPKGRKPRQRKQ
jgi:poly(hydroxyalkanoate) granule-associated protein